MLYQGLVLVFILCVNCFFCGCVADQNKELPLPSKFMGDAESVTATVVEINYDTRRAVLKMTDGNTVQVSVTEDAYNFDQVVVGDLVDMTYMESVAVLLEKNTGATPALIRSSGMIRAPKGQKPEGVTYKTTDVLAKVVGIDYAARTVDLLGPNGNTISIKVDERVEDFENIKEGDEVLARYTEAMAISVHPAGTGK
jgi:hypothetical protein